MHFDQTGHIWLIELCLQASNQMFMREKERAALNLTPEEGSEDCLEGESPVS